MPDVIVIGAGISGLSCAWALKKLGVDVEVFESSSRAGGVIRTEYVDGYRIESGPNSFQSSSQSLRMIEEIGLTEELVSPGTYAPRFIYFKGQLRRFPLGPMSVGGLVRVLGEPFVRSKSPREESVKEFFSRRFGNQAHDRLVAPMLAGIFAANTAELSMAAALPGIVALEREYGSLITGTLKRAFTRRTDGASTTAGARGICSFKEGMGALTTRLAERVSVRFDVSDAKVGEAKATVITVPAYRAVGLLEKRYPDLARLFENVKYAPMVIAATSLPQESFPPRLRGFGFLAPRDQGLHHLGTLFSSALFENRAPEEHVLLTSFIGGSLEPETIDWPDEQIWEIVCSELEQVLQTTSSPRPIVLYRHRNAIPQYNIGHEHWVESVKREVNRIPGLFVTANYMEGVSVPACMEQGERTAHAVAEYLRSNA